MNDDLERCQVLLALLSLKGLGRKTARKILGTGNQFPGTPEDLLEMVLDRGGKRLSERNLDECSHAWQSSQRLLDSLLKKRLEVVIYTANHFPSQLQHIQDPPAVLFVRGSVDVLQRKCVGVIGSRTPDSYGKKVAERIGRQCAVAGFPVVSGLAAGCDTAAHRGCIDGGEPTVAFLAHGLDHVFPPENRSLADQIVEQGGPLVSEYFPEIRNHAGLFVDRDRLQSGQSAGVILIQSELQGGSMHTIRFAQQEERVIAVVVPPEKEPAGELYAGNQKLIDGGDVFPMGNSTELSRCLEDLSIEKSPKTGSSETVHQPDLWD